MNWQIGQAVSGTSGMNLQTWNSTSCSRNNRKNWLTGKASPGTSGMNWQTWNSTGFSRNIRYELTSREHNRLLQEHQVWTDKQGTQQADPEYQIRIYKQGIQQTALEHQGWTAKQKTEQAASGTSDMNWQIGQAASGTSGMNWETGSWTVRSWPSKQGEQGADQTVQVHQERADSQKERGIRSLCHNHIWISG
jgi:hypothetical protein